MATLPSKSASPFGLQRVLANDREVVEKVVVVGRKSRSGVKGVTSDSGPRVSLDQSLSSSSPSTPLARPLSMLSLLRQPFDSWISILSLTCYPLSARLLVSRTATARNDSMVFTEVDLLSHYPHL
jgi:hypothetical protein